MFSLKDHVLGLGTEGHVFLDFISIGKFKPVTSAVPFPHLDLKPEPLPVDTPYGHTSYPELPLCTLLYLSVASTMLWYMLAGPKTMQEHGEGNPATF